MSLKTRPSIFMIVLFSLTTLATLGGIYIVIDRLLLSEDVQSSLRMFAKKITPDQFYMAVAIVLIVIVMKWVGSFLMLRNKAWAYILYVIPNLLLISIMGYLIFYNFRTDTIWGYGIGTLAFIIAYTVALVFILKKRNSTRTNTYSV